VDELLRIEEELEADTAAEATSREDHSAVPAPQSEQPLLPASVPFGVRLIALEAA
jgi:hypothetical protein